MIDRLFQPVDGKSLAIFRILFGCLMFWQLCIDFPLYGIMYNPSSFHFTYPLFGWVKPWPSPGMLIVSVTLGIAALGVILGLCYRWSAFLLFLTETYIFLLDQTYYQNHYYLYCLISFVMIGLDAHRNFSLDAWLNPKLKGPIPAWNILILRAQIVIVYFYAGVAKINPDWLQGEPMRTELGLKASAPIPDDLIRSWLAPLVIPYLKKDWFIYLFSYSGLIFDLTIGFLLLWRKTRWFAFGLTLLFHSTTKFLFGLHTFPLVMISTLALFMPLKKLSLETISLAKQKIILYAISFYLMIQLIVPLRPWLIPGSCLWTEEGRIFSWYMKIRIKRVEHCLIWVKPSKDSSLQSIDLRKDLNLQQINSIAVNPQLLLQYVHHLKAKYQKQGFTDPVITAEILVSMNNRPIQYLVDPSVNLAKETYPFLKHAPWVRQLE